MRVESNRLLFSRRNLVLLALAAVILLVWSTWALTLRLAAPGLSQATAEVRALKQELKTLNRKLETSRAREKVAEQNTTIMRQANQLLREEESLHQEEMQQLQNELDFFRRLAGTSGTQSGLAIYHLALTPTGSGRVFRFELTLTQNLQRSAITTGTVQIDLEGVIEDQPVSLPWSQISNGSDPEPDFRFKYFQQIDGYVVVPEDLDPERMLITLNVKGQRKPIHRAFDWNLLTSG